MDMASMIQEALQKALVAEGARLLEEAMKMKPVIVGDLSYNGAPYARFVEYGQPPNVVDSTAIVIDENVRALPEPKKGSK